MNIEKEREKLILFTKVGVIVLTSIALLASSFFLYPENQEVISNSLIQGKRTSDLLRGKRQTSNINKF